MRHFSYTFISMKNRIENRTSYSKCSLNADIICKSALENKKCPTRMHGLVASHVAAKSHVTPEGCGWIAKQNH